ncbi:flagellin N-terminal helical domain-containing protein [Bosea thiooxidans]
MGSSLLTNAASMQALATLRMTNKSLDKTQDMVSTGLRVATATDNAAYWSIATTMKSDNKALGAVQDALGLGAATLDMMYTGLNSSVEVVTEIKAKLVAARQPGVDRSKIQDDVSELQKQLRGSADSTVFNGENWVSVDSSVPGYNDTKSVVSSFSRTGGVVTIDTVAVNQKDIKLFDANTVGSTVDYSTSKKVITFDPTAVGAAVDADGNFTITVDSDGTAGISASDAKYTVNVTENDTAKTLADKINALGIEGFTVAVDNAGTGLSAYNRGEFDVLFTDGAAGSESGLAGAGFTGGVTALGTYVEMQKGVLDKSYDAYNAATDTWSSFSVAGATDAIDISKLTDSASDLQILERYVAVVDKALANITTSASSLGSIKSRVGLQQDFVKSLTDSLSRGIGQLVDADMNEVSTRLQALQTQQQLAVQSLSIANGNSQTILSLFRG